MYGSVVNLRMVAGTCRARGGITSVGVGRRPGVERRPWGCLVDAPSDRETILVDGVSEVSLVGEPALDVVESARFARSRSCQGPLTMTSVSSVVTQVRLDEVRSRGCRRRSPGEIRVRSADVRRVSSSAMASLRAARTICSSSLWVRSASESWARAPAGACCGCWVVSSRKSLTASGASFSRPPRRRSTPARCRTLRDAAASRSVRLLIVGYLPFRRRRPGLGGTGRGGLCGTGTSGPTSR